MDCNSLFVLMIREMTGKIHGSDHRGVPTSMIFAESAFQPYLKTVVIGLCIVNLL